MIYLYYLGLFCKYDFGEIKNQEKYGQKNPPEYEVEAIKLPVVTYWGDNDWLVEPTVSTLSFNDYNMYFCILIK